MPLRNFRTVSFVGIKRAPTDPCILRSVRPIDEINPLPRSNSDLSQLKQSDHQSKFEGIPELHMTPPNLTSRTLPKDFHSKSYIPVESVDEVDEKSGLITPPSPPTYHEIQNGMDEPVIVVRRNKGNAPAVSQKRNRRRGLVLQEHEDQESGMGYISSPILISHPSLRSGNGRPFKPRSTEEQHELLRELAESHARSQSSSKLDDDANNNGDSRRKKAERSVALEPLKDGSSPRSRRAISGGKMAGRIQRTIRALYESGRQASFERLDDKGSSEDELDDSPKPEKRNTRKSRSPKPARRTGVPIKDVDGSRRFKWRGSVNRIVKKFGQGQTLIPGGTFDVHLEDCPPSSNNELVPFVVDLCCRIVEEHGLYFTGIYRVPGNSGTLSSLQEDLNTRGPELDVENDPRLRELNVVSSLLKSFFRKLPDPLFTNELYDDFISMNRKKDSEERLNGLRRLIHMLPAPHYETLKFLITHLRKVADHSEFNKMEIRNLAIVFGPTLVRSTVSDNMATMVTDMSDQCRIVESVLQHADWFLTRDNQESGDRNQPVPKEEHHEPVPNIDHLLANVGRTPGDASDNTSESSRSKVSNVSEKDSFSRDVIDMIFGAKKKLLHNPHRGAKEEGIDTSDDEYGFKEAERRARASAEPPRSPTKSPPSPKVATQPYKVARPVASDIRANWHGRSRLALPGNIAASLYDYYVENVNKFNRNDITQTPYQQASSAESSPPITVRSSAPIPPVQRTYAMQPRRSAQPPLQSNGWKVTSPQLPPFKNSPPPLKSSDLQSASAHSFSSLEPQGQEDSDSDTSIYVGDTLEEKLRNLTNLDKKLERRPSRRRGNPPEFLMRVKAASEAPAKPLNKKLTAPSQLAGEPITPDNLHMYVGKKSTRELYRERKAQRQHHREVIRARRSDNSSAHCTSEENLFNRADPKRQIVRSTAHDDTYRRAQPSGEKVRRRHTLGGADFSKHEVYDEHQYNSMQNVSCEDPASAMARLRPQFGASAPLLQAVSNSRIFFTSNNRQEQKTESYL